MDSTAGLATILGSQHRRNDRWVVADFIEQNQYRTTSVKGVRALHAADKAFNVAFELKSVAKGDPQGPGGREAIESFRG